MFELKACPRCRGDMRVSHDIHGDYKQCLQCGNSIELKPATRRRLFLTMRVDTGEFSQCSTAANRVGDPTLSDG